MKTIEIIVDKQGCSRLETKGFTGTSCREASRLLEAALGTTANDTNTAEFYSAGQSMTETARE